MSDRPADYLALCNEALDDYEKCKEVDASYRVLYNRLYYACFYAANAALLSYGIETKTHRGAANRVFQVFYQDEELLSRETAAFLSRVQTKRDTADYHADFESTPEELREIERGAHELIEELKSIAESGADDPNR